MRSGADHGAIGESTVRRPGTIVIGGRTVRYRGVLVLAVLGGLAVAGVAMLATGLVDPDDPLRLDAGSWPVSIVFVAILAALCLFGVFTLVGLMRTPASRVLRYQLVPRWLLWPTALAIAPAFLALFFFLVSMPTAGIGNRSVTAYVPAALAVLFVVVWPRLFLLLSERLLIGFFLWLGLILAPIVLDDLILDLLASVLIGTLAGTGVLP